jgi:N-acetylneuraminic acid mutarotase
MGKGRDKKKKASGANAKKAKNAEKQEAKALKQKVKQTGADFEDIDAILAELAKEQENQYKVTEESNCDPPSRRVNFSFTANPLNGNELIIFGGEYYDGQIVHMYNDFYRYNIDKNEWKRITSPNSPGPRSAHQVAITASGTLFLFGGEFVSPNESNFFHYKDMWCMNLKQGCVWEKLDVKIPPARSGHRIVSWKRFLILFGGFYDQAHETKYFDDLWVFDTAEFTWKCIEMSDPKPSPRSGFSFFLFGDNLVLYGGYSKVFKKGTRTVGVQHVDAWMLKLNEDFKNLKWERRKKVGGVHPGQRSGCSMVFHKGKGIMFGGVSDIEENDENLESIVFQDLFQYIVEGNKFYPITLRKRKTDGEFNNGQSGDVVPGPRFNPGLAISKNTLYMFGGAYELNNIEYTLEDFWSLNLEKLDEWKPIIRDEIASSFWKGENSDEDESDEDIDDDEDVDSRSETSDLSDNSMVNGNTNMVIDSESKDPVPGGIMYLMQNHSLNILKEQALIG